MPNDPHLRASDADRDHAAALLREHHAAGRLTAEEFQERLDAAYEAKTLGDLDKLLADLPHIDLYQLPAASMRRAAASRPLEPATVSPGRLSPHWRAAWGSWASVSLLLFVIWLIGAVTSHSASGLWFLWVSGPWGAVLLGRWLFGGPPQHPRSRIRGADRGSPPELRADHQDPGRGDRCQ